MKKFLLSVGVVVSFALYSFARQHGLTDDDRTVPLVPPTIPSPTAPENPQPTPAGESPKPTNIPVPTAVPTRAGQYNDGTYMGDAADAFYGLIQVKAVIQNGRLADVQFLQYPNDRQTSIEINTQAMPWLKEEAIAAQSANVDIISGATDSSQAFRQSLGSALAKAK
jgi:uncharacterized protein with FMN-binding domain